jgi:thiol-disulfide isomerase/thioredoxin
MPDEFTHLITGDDIPEFHVRTIDGQDLYIGREPGRIMLLHFFILSCPYCRKSLERLDMLQEKYKGNQGFFMLSIGREHTSKELRAYREANKLELCMAPDPDRGIYNNFAIKKVPRCYLFSKEGTLLFQIRGSDESAFHDLMQIIRTELAGE